MDISAHRPARLDRARPHPGRGPAVRVRRHEHRLHRPGAVAGLCVPGGSHLAPAADDRWPDRGPDHQRLDRPARRGFRADRGAGRDPGDVLSRPAGRCRSTRSTPSSRRSGSASRSPSATASPAWARSSCAWRAGRRLLPTGARTHGRAGVDGEPAGGPAGARCPGGHARDARSTQGLIGGSPERRSTPATQSPRRAIAPSDLGARRPNRRMLGRSGRAALDTSRDPRPACDIRSAPRPDRRPVRRLGRPAPGGCAGRAQELPRGATGCAGTAGTCRDLAPWTPRRVPRGAGSGRACASARVKGPGGGAGPLHMAVYQSGLPTGTSVTRMAFTIGASPRCATNPMSR